MLQSEVAPLKDTAGYYQSLQNIFMQSPVAICMLSVPQLVIDLANEKALQLWDRPAGVIGKSLVEVFPELVDQGFEDILRAVYTTGEKFVSNETPVKLRRNGVLGDAYINFVYEPIRDPNGDITSIMGIGVEVTPMVQARIKAEDSEQQFQNLISQSPAAIAILKGPGMVITIANAAILEMWGKGNDVVGKPLLSIMPEVVEQGFGALLNNVFTTGTSHHAYESKVRLKRNGVWEDVYFTFSYQAYREVSGEITGVTIVAYEVTPQALANKKITNSEGRFRNLILQSPVAMAVYRAPDSVIELANEKTLHIWGKTFEEVKGRSLFSIFPDAAGQRVIHAQVYATGLPYMANEQFVKYKRYGEERSGYFNLVYQPVKNEDGIIDHIILVAHDVTEQVLARKQVFDAEEKLRVAVEATDLGTFDADLVADKITYSLRLQEIFGFSRDARPEWKDLVARFHEEDKPKRQQAMAEAMKGGLLDYELRIVLPDSSVRWIRLRGRVLYNADKKPERILGTVLDVTEQVIHTEVLEQKVLERTHELERTNAGLQEFAYAASHDMQEPLRKIQTFSSMMEKYINDPVNAHKYLEKIQSSASRMSVLIKDVLNYSMLSKPMQQATRVDLNTLLRNIQVDFELLIQEKQARIEVGLLPVLYGIPHQLSQLFANLISNALKFSKEHPFINISSAPLTVAQLSSYPDLDNGSEYNIITVQDNGIGFEQSYADQIFTIFQRLNNDGYTGTGIGLALCRKIVDNHGGTIFATSSPGHGAIFHIILPVVR
ncbi:MAG: PAS domain-containing protein [Taibaiella sp.]|nr:PAS domain-containing protein [Taibaiella sp.]